MEKSKSYLQKKVFIDKLLSLYKNAVDIKEKTGESWYSEAICRMIEFANKNL